MRGRLALPLLATLLGACAGPVPEQRLELDLAGLHCRGCSNRIAFELRRLPGVRICRVDDPDAAGAARCVVEYDGSLLDAAGIVDAVEALDRIHVVDAPSAPAIR